MIARAATVPRRHLVAIWCPLAEREPVERLLMGIEVRDSAVVTIAGRIVYRNALACGGHGVNRIRREDGVEAWRFVISPAVCETELRRRLPPGCEVERFTEERP